MRSGYTLIRSQGDQDGYDSDGERIKPELKRSNSRQAVDKETEDDTAAREGIDERSTVSMAVGATGTYAYRSVMVSGGRAYVPVAHPTTTPSQKAVSRVNAALSIMRYYVSGVLRDHESKA